MVSTVSISIYSSLVFLLTGAKWENVDKLGVVYASPKVLRCGDIGQSVFRWVFFFFWILCTFSSCHHLIILSCIGETLGWTISSGLLPLSVGACRRSPASQLHLSCLMQTARAQLFELWPWARSRLKCETFENEDWVKEGGVSRNSVCTGQQWAVFLANFSC